MQYISTRGQAPELGFEDVLLAGLARDGGLYLPQSWPKISRETIRSFASKPFAEIAVEVIHPFTGVAISRDALRRVENMVSMAGLNFPVHVIRDQMASTLNLLIHVGRMTGGKRKVLSISEVTGIESSVVLIQELFVFRQEGVNGSGDAHGRFESCGVRPRVLSRIESEGIYLPNDLWRRR